MGVISQAVKMVKPIVNPNYYPTYVALGASGILLVTYVTDWERVGKLIPVWNKRYESVNN